MSIDDQIKSAGALLMQRWNKSGTLVAPENDLHPDPARIQFRVKLLEDRIAGLEQEIARLKRHVGSS